MTSRSLAPREPGATRAATWLGALAAASSIVALPLALGCGGYDPPPGAGADGLRNAARARAAAEIPCDDSELSVRALGSGGFRVQGCGQWMSYTCTKTAGGFLCSPNERGRVEVDPTRHWTDEDVQRLHARVAADLAECLPDSQPSLALSVLLRTDGRVVRTGTTAASGELWRCIDRRLAVEHMGRVVTASRVVTLPLDRAAHQRLGASDAPPPPTVAPEAATRAAIDARAPAILACVESDALSLQVSWDREGHLDALLRAERAGTAEESCVRAIVQQLTIAAPRSPGTILHAIQR